MDIDKEKIKSRFAEINEALAEAKRLAGLSDEEFRLKKEYIAAVKYNLLLAIEAAGSICVHISAKKFNKGVTAFGECFEILAKEDFLDAGLADKLRKMAKFRNKLIHRYWEIENEKILEYARRNLSDFNDFMKAIDKLL
jgi:uncharacterized protein YutE (UPF0331/DUF86 family)